MPQLADHFRKFSRNWASKSHDRFQDDVDGYLVQRYVQRYLENEDYVDRFLAAEQPA